MESYSVTSYRSLVSCFAPDVQKWLAGESASESGTGVVRRWGRDASYEVGHCSNLLCPSPCEGCGSSNTPIRYTTSLDPLVSRRKQLLKSLFCQTILRDIQSKLNTLNVRYRLLRYPVSNNNSIIISLFLSAIRSKMLYNIIFNKIDYLD